MVQRMGVGGDAPSAIVAWCREWGVMHQVMVQRMGGLMHRVWLWYGAENVGVMHRVWL